MRQTLWVAGDVVWWPGRSGAGHEKVAVVTVSYNTRELTALLLWSLRTIVNWPDLEIVVVDNGSADGSAELLAEAARAAPGVDLDPGLRRRCRTAGRAVGGPGRRAGPLSGPGR